MKILRTYLAICVVVAGMSLSGSLDFAEYRLVDERFRWLQREATGDIVLVTIDSRSLRQLGVWPWPRSLHAEAIERLSAAGAADIFYNVDFSSRSSDDEDAALEAALSRSGARVVLPAFIQSTSLDGGYSYTEPLPRLRRHVEIASINLQPDRDGLIRRMQTRHPGQDSDVPSLPAMVLGAGSELPAAYLIDFGIRLESIPAISFASLLDGDFDPAVIAGRHVLVGATAGELSAGFTVPVWTSLPGVLVQAQALESVLGGRALQMVPGWINLLAISVFVLGLGPALARWPWRQGLAFTVAAAAASALLALTAQRFFPLIVGITPWILAAVLVYGVGLVRRIDEQNHRLLTDRQARSRRDAFMQRIINNPMDGILAIDAAGAIVSFSPAAERIFGFRSAQMLGRGIGELFDPATSADDGAAADRHTLAWMEALAIIEHPCEVLGHRQDGEPFTMDIAVSVMAEEEARGFIVLVRDVSDRKSAETAALQARQRLDEAIESISEAFVLWDADDRLVLCNRKFRELMGAGGESVAPGCRFEDLMREQAPHARPNDEAARRDAWIRMAVRRHRRATSTFEYRFPNGRWYRVSERRTRDGGIVGILTDVTAAKENEQDLRAAKDQAEAANHAKTAFLANMSHELRTPLNAIIGFAEMIESQVVGEIGDRRYLEYANDIRDSGTHLLGVIKDILDISRVETGMLDLHIEDFELAPVIGSCMRVVQGQAEKAGLDLSTEIGPDLRMIRADERLLRQIVINLLSNAIKFTPAGGDVGVSVDCNAAGNMRIRVRDTGIGIEMEEIPRVLKPFGQVENATSRKFDGVGLGLPLARSFAELHGGSLEIASDIGTGTTVTVLIPDARAESQDLPAEYAQQAGTRKVSAAGLTASGGAD